MPPLEYDLSQTWCAACYWCFFVAVFVHVHPDPMGIWAIFCANVRVPMTLTAQQGLHALTIGESWRVLC